MVPLLPNGAKRRVRWWVWSVFRNNAVTILSFANRFPCKMKLAEDGGIIVDSEMRTTVDDVYAAGDVCTPKWSQQSALWFQVGQSTPTAIGLTFVCVCVCVWV